jgi:hypothetical protein
MVLVQRWVALLLWVALGLMLHYRIGHTSTCQTRHGQPTRARVLQRVLLCLISFSTRVAAAAVAAAAAAPAAAVQCHEWLASCLFQ